jgi:copper(I)-binding protein
MLIGPKRGFAVGDHIRAILRFEYAGSVRVDFRVQLAPPRTDDAHAPVNMH